MLHGTSPLTEQREDQRIGLLNRFPGRVYESSGNPVPGVHELVPGFW